MTIQPAFKDAGLSRPVQTQLFIGGEFVDAIAGGTIDVLNPFDNSKICAIAEAREEDVDTAVAAAKAAFPAWSRMDAADRGQFLLKLADAIEANAEEFIRLEALDTGHPVRDARKLDVPRTARCYRYFGGMADKVEGFLPPVYPGFINYVQREPLGVVGQVIPWNFPLMFTAWKMAPALAAGNTIVIKPSEITPLSILPMETGFTGVTRSTASTVPVPFAVISVPAESETTVSNSMGQFTLDGLTTTGPVSVVVNAAGFSDLVTSVTLVSGSVVLQDLVLTPL